MPIALQVDPSDRLVTATLEGTPAFAEYADAARAILADPRVTRGFAIIVDGGALDELPNVDEMRDLVNVARELRLRGIEPVALVAANDGQFVVGQLFATLANAAINLDVRVFRSSGIAREWLRGRPARNEVGGPPADAGGPPLPA